MIARGNLLVEAFLFCIIVKLDLFGLFEQEAYTSTSCDAGQLNGRGLMMGICVVSPSLYASLANLLLSPHTQLRILLQSNNGVCVVQLKFGPISDSFERESSVHLRPSLDTILYTGILTM